MPKGFVPCLTVFWATLVAIRFMHNGKQWEADTPEEAMRLRESLETATLRRKTEAGERLQVSEGNVWTPDVFTEFTESIGILGQSFLKYLLERPSTLVPTSEVAKELGLKKGIELAGVLSGLSKQLKKVGLRPHQLYFVDVSWDGREKERSVGIDRGFEQAASEMGWPEK
jgi:hypothetical protein